MKKRFLCLVAVLVLCLSVCLTSCNKDKKTIYVCASELPHADILENAEEILVGDGLELFYKENELLCNYRNNDLYLSDYPIDRESLLQMDYETFRSFLDENAVLEEKKREEKQKHRGRFWVLT